MRLKFIGPQCQAGLGAGDEGNNDCVGINTPPTHEDELEKGYPDA